MRTGLSGVSVYGRPNGPVTGLPGPLSHRDLQARAEAHCERLPISDRRFEQLNQLVG